jgi:hypothetical protein
VTAALYTRGAATAARLLAKYGAAVTLRSFTPGTYNKDTGVRANPAPTSNTRNGALFDIDHGVKDIRGKLVETGDKELLMEPGVAPKAQDSVTVGGIQYTVVSVGELNPAGTPVLFTLHLRK